MPTVLRFDGLRAVIYPNDHRPADVHVIGIGPEAVFNLDCPVGPAVVRENYGFPRREISHIERVLTNHLGSLCGDWGSIHGRV